MDDYSSKEDCV